ncbi:DNA-binding transcriptional regulator, MarR family [Curtobacterium sp. UNCCL20]|uniref:MarR family winged helix-turn-helix transcriptional regulator n=1 Tax=Curtobacterium sp. UNCCL20 TaxID=1502773 RepID=UPI00088B3BA0|nr:MarR family transcriptional regulator [Curtobacterium sp. UNCCL20]SDQ13070.1 DNA-binding transcriptional regulator, MarR family [Curtobacterium sp. UNCCL20]
MSATPSALTPTQLGAYFAFTEVGSLLRPAVEQQLRDAGGLSSVQFQLLARLGDSAEGQQRMTDLADGVVYSRSGLTYQAQLLEQRGLISRGPSPDDERSTVVTLTDAGRDVLAAVFPGHIATVYGLLFSAITDEDASDLARILGRVSEHLRAAPPRSASRRRK